MNTKITNKYFSLFLSFLKIGLFTFGGGYAMIALLEKEFVEKKQYLSNSEFIDIIAIAESTPGPIAINMATYIGYKKGKILGAILSTIAVCLPSFLIIYIISLFFDKFLELTYVQYAFKGIQVCVIYLIFSAGYKMIKQMNKDLLTIIIFTIVFISMIIFSCLAINFSSIFYILIGIVIGVISFFIERIKKHRLKENEEKSL